ncbi:hypothetical protein XENTR_v10011196 [Xenopus tropicalis]|nr:hypothetical protein XENTR_v10011196 [Xenopus tropicalis]
MVQSLLIFLLFCRYIQSIWVTNRCNTLCLLLYMKYIYFHANYCFPPKSANLCISLLAGMPHFISKKNGHK